MAAGLEASILGEHAASAISAAQPIERQTRQVKALSVRAVAIVED